MGAKHARRTSLRGRFVRMIVFRTIVSTAVLLGSLYAGLAAGQRIVAYRQRLDQRHAEQPVPVYVRPLPQPEPRLHVAGAIGAQAFR